jgi:pyruvate/2-oxoglutarate dehydrogenase complex dihydrolipoamide acyltransferase (E2) component
MQDRYETLPFPKYRRFLVDTVALGSRKHLIHGLLEIDVTDARRYLRGQADESGRSPSFTGFIIACVGRAVDEHKIMHAYRGSRDRLVLFEDVDIATIVEVETEDRKFPLGHIVRAANRKSLPEIHDEIRSVQAEGQVREETMPGGALLLNLPGFLRRLLYRLSIRSPQRMKTNAGTVLVTAVGMFGRGTGWGIPVAIHSLAVTIGGIAEKPGLVDGCVEAREFLSLTISFDHDIIDGAPAARFAGRLEELVESGYGLRPEG